MTKPPKWGLKASKTKVPTKFASIADNSRLAFSKREAAIAFGVCERTISNWIDSGLLRAVKIDRTVRIPRDALLALLNGGEE